MAIDFDELPTDESEVSEFYKHSDFLEEGSIWHSLWDNKWESVSAFPESNDIATLPFTEFQEKSQKAFVVLVTRRVAYVDELETLQAGWISGGGEVPSREVLEQTKSLLVYLQEQARHRPFRVVPHLVIGPTPQGGMELELHSERDTALFVCLHNDQSVEIDIKYQGHYSSLETELTHIGHKVFAHYESISES